MNANTNTPKTADPYAPSSYLCYAWGETDYPVAQIVDTVEAVGRFFGDHWFGEHHAPGENEDFDAAMARVTAAKDDPDSWDGSCEIDWEFEIGGVSVTKVYVAAAAPQPEATSTEAGNAVAWIPPEREGEYHSSDFINASRTEKAGWEPLFRAQRAAQAPTAVQASTADALDEMDSCIRVSRAYKDAGERCAEIDPDAVSRWRTALYRAALATAAVQGDASSVSAPVVTVAAQGDEAWLQDAHSDNAPLGFNSHERGSWSIGYETGYRAALAAASSVQPAGAGVSGFAKSLDGIKEITCMPGSGVDGSRTHDEIRAVVTTLVAHCPRTWQGEWSGRPKSADECSSAPAPAAPGPAASSAVPTRNQVIDEVADRLDYENLSMSGFLVRTMKTPDGAAASPALAPEQSHE